MRFVTTCNRDGWERYGQRLWESWDNAPANAELIWYAEGFNPGEKRGITVVSTDKLQDLQTFKLRYERYRPPGWRWDVSKFAHKVFAAIDGFANYKGLGVWIDADCVIHKQIEPGKLEEFLPEGFYLSIFRRRGLTSETGLFMVDCSHQHHTGFLYDWQSWYDSGEFRNLGEWHAAATLDATIRTYERERLIEVFSLSGKHEKELRPMMYSPLAEWFSHSQETAAA